MPHGPMTVGMGTETSKKAAPAGNAYGILSIGVPEGHRFFPDEGIQPWSISGGISQMPHGIQAHFIRVQNDTVMSFYKILLV